MKLCSRCKKERNKECFGKSSRNSDGLQAWCKKCYKQYNDDNATLLCDKKKEYYLKNKDVMDENSKKYYLKNKESVNEGSKKYYLKNKDKLVKYRKEYVIKNKDLVYKKNKKYRSENRITVALRKKNYSVEKAKYNTYFDKLTIDESAVLSEDNISLEVMCKYCGKYFIPTNLEVNHRISALGSTKLGDSFLYCSQGCKDACPVYGRMLWPKGFKKASSREVNPLVRQMCFERDNWECQSCGATQNEAQLHCHHIEGYAQNPRLGNDVTNTVTLCKTCHKEVHKLTGCNYNDLKCSE